MGNYNLPEKNKKFKVVALEQNDSIDITTDFVKIVSLNNNLDISVIDLNTLDFYVYKVSPVEVIVGYRKLRIVNNSSNLCYVIYDELV